MVYVDDMRAPYGRMVLCHMVADSTAELRAMADRIGLQYRWIQHVGTAAEHFDISLQARAKAVKAGAREVTRRQLGCRRIVLTYGLKPCADPQCWERTAKRIVAERHGRLPD